MSAKYVKKKLGKSYTAVEWLKEHPEDIPMARENLKSRDAGFADDDIKQLMAAICLRACVDYRRASMGKKIDEQTPEQTIYECRKFFASDIFQMFINRIPVSDVEKYIRATPDDAINKIWKYNENIEQSKAHLINN